MTCLDEARILDLIEGRLAAADEAQVKGHVDACDSCRRLLAATARSLSAERTPDAGDVRQAVGRYAIMGTMGSGSMGLVYLAYDPQLDREVALKVIRIAGELPPAQLATMLLAEAQTMARLAHPAVVAVHDAGTTDDGEVYVVMERVEGVTLRRWLQAPGRDWRAVVDAYLQAGQGLAAAHRAGIVHGDFKPDNVLLGEDGRPRVTDFGLARPMRGASGAAAGTLALAPAAHVRHAAPRLDGTPAYMAPELLQGTAPGAGSDQFAFCVALYEGLYGERPFAGGSLQELAQHALAGAVREPRPRAGVPRRVRAILLRGLAARPADRFPSLDALLRALTAARQRTRRRTALAAAAVLIAALAAVVTRSLLDPAHACRDVGSELQGVWDAPSRQAIQQAFVATRLSFADDAWRGVARALDRQAGDWIAARAELCRASAGSADPLDDVLRRRKVCLDDNRRQLRALVTVLRGADREVVLRAVEAALALPAVAGCQGEQAEPSSEVLPADPAQREHHARVREALATAGAQERAGRYLEAQRGLEALRADLPQGSGLALEAQVLALAGRVAGRLGDIALARTELQRAAETALAGEAHEVAARAYLDLMFFVSHGEGRADDAQRWDRLAQAAIGRGGDRLPAQAERLEVLSILLWDQGQLEQAEDALRRARDIYVQVHGPQHLRVAHTLDGLATLLCERGELEQARALSLQAVAMAEQSFGPWHPALLAFLNNLGNSEALLGRYGEAQATLTRALLIAEELLGPWHLDLVPPLDSLGSLLSLMGQHAEASAVLERAWELLRAGGHEVNMQAAVVRTDLASALLAAGEPALALQGLDAVLALLSGPEVAPHPQLAVVQGLRGQALLALGQPAAALPEFDSALAVVNVLLGPQATAAAPALLGLGEALLLLGDAVAALEPLERALLLRLARPGDPRETAAVRFALARALWAAGVDRSRVQTLAAQARADLIAQGWSPQQLARVEAWLTQVNALPPP